MLNGEKMGSKFRLPSKFIGICLVSVTFVHCVKTAKDTALVAMESEQETVPKLSNGTIFYNFE